MVRVAPPARPAAPGQIRELGAAGLAVARRGEARAEGLVAAAATASSASGLTHRPLAKTPQEPRYPAVRTQSPGAISVQPWPHMGYPTPAARRRTLGRVAGAAQHRGVGDVERRTARRERDDVIDGQVGGAVGGALVAGHRLPCSPRQARSTRALSRCQARVLYSALCRLRLDCRACSVQRLPARLVTTPQTVHSFTRELWMGWLARSIRPRCYAPVCGWAAAVWGRA